MLFVTRLLLYSVSKRQLFPCQLTLPHIPLVLLILLLHLSLLRLLLENRFICVGHSASRADLARLLRTLALFGSLVARSRLVGKGNVTLLVSRKPRLIFAPRIIENLHTAFNQCSDVAHNLTAHLFPLFLSMPILQSLLGCKRGQRSLLATIPNTSPLCHVAALLLPSAPFPRTIDILLTHHSARSRRHCRGGSRTFVRLLGVQVLLRLQKAGVHVPKVRNAGSAAAGHVGRAH
mmetsp:Transcript_5392/g.20495  ORF Transcript_5392/g.20495 Transcript_5392/m.20495 type:complete len:234 (+) Transcript_5392:1397-2098(+)